MRLRTLLGDHACTSALKDGSIKSDLVTLDFAEYSPTNKGFKPMVNSLYNGSRFEDIWLDK